MRSSPFGGIPRNWKQGEPIDLHFGQIQVPPSGGSLEIGNNQWTGLFLRNSQNVPPSGGSLEIGNIILCRNKKTCVDCSPFGGIPRNWKPEAVPHGLLPLPCSPFGGIPRNWKHCFCDGLLNHVYRSPFGGIPRNWKHVFTPGCVEDLFLVPPSGGSLEIGNESRVRSRNGALPFPLRGDP